MSSHEVLPAVSGEYSSAHVDHWVHAALLS